MLDRLVYVLFFIFIGSGLFLVYQGLKGMGYLGPAPVTQAPIPPPVAQNPVISVEEAKEAGVEIGPVDGNELDAIAYMVKSLPETDQAAGCQFFWDHYSKLELKEGETNLDNLLKNVLDVFAASEQLPSTHNCLLEVTKKTFSVAHGVKGFDFKNENGAEFLAKALPALIKGGYFSLVSQIHDAILPILKMKLPGYSSNGNLIEHSLCMGLKHMGRKSECQFLYPITDSPNMQVYSLAYKVFYDEEWGRLYVYTDRMRDYKKSGRWMGFEIYLRGLYQVHVKNDLESGLKKYEQAVLAAKGWADLSLEMEYKLALIRLMRQMGRHQEALGRVDSFLEMADQNGNSGFEVMAMLLQKLMIKKELGQSVDDAQAIQKKFSSVKPDDEYGELVAKAIDALITGSQTFEPTIKSVEFLEVQKVLSKQ